jgi:hypothetical protein
MVPALARSRFLNGPVDYAGADPLPETPMAPIRPLLLALATALALGACAPVDSGVSAGAPGNLPPPPTPREDEEPMTCDAKDTAWALGKTADEATVTRVRTETGSKSVRVIKPGMAVTMDYREDRVNIDVDDANRILKVRCG